MTTYGPSFVTTDLAQLIEKIVTDVTNKVLNKHANAETQALWGKNASNQLEMQGESGFAREVRQNLANLTSMLANRHEQPEVVVPDAFELRNVAEDLASLATHQNMTMDHVERADMGSMRPSYFLTPVGVAALMAVIITGMFEGPNNKNSIKIVK